MNGGHGNGTHTHHNSHFGEKMNRIDGKVLNHIKKYGIGSYRVVAIIYGTVTKAINDRTRIRIGHGTSA